MSRLALVSLLVLGCGPTASAPARDAGTTDAFVPSVCDPAWSFCDDFEDGDTAGWTVSGDVAVVASTGGPSGSALRARVDAAGTPAFLSMSLTSGVEQHVRFYLRLPASAPPTLFRLVELSEPATGDASWLGMLRGEGGAWQPQIGQSLPTGGGGGPGLLTGVPGDTWLCVEVGIANHELGGLSAPLVTVRVARPTGETLTESSLGTGTEGVDLRAFTSLRFGVLAPHPTETADPIAGPLEVDLDDVAFDDVRIVCGS